MAVMTVEVNEWERMEQQITTLRAQLSIEEGVVDDYCEQIDELKAQLAEAQRLWKQAVGVNADRLEEMLTAVVHKENEQLKADLAKHGGHTAECASQAALEEWDCDCGWAEIEKGLG